MPISVVRRCNKSAANQPPDGKTTKELIPERLGLSNGRKTAVLDALGVELHRVLGERETLLHDGSELTDPPALVSKNALRAGGTDDDLGTGRGDADLDTRVAVLGQLAREELVELGVEDTVGNKLSRHKTEARVRYRFESTVSRPAPWCSHRGPASLLQNRIACITAGRPTIDTRGVRNKRPKCRTHHKSQRQDGSRRAVHEHGRQTASASQKQTNGTRYPD